MTDLESQLEQLVERVVRKVLAEKPANEPAPEYVSPAEYARARSISESTVRAAIRENRLEHIRIGRAVRIPTTAAIGKKPIDERDVTERARLVLLGGGKGR